MTTILAFAGIFLAACYFVWQSISYGKELERVKRLEEKEESDNRQEEKVYHILKHNEEIANLTDDELNNKL